MMMCCHLLAMGGSSAKAQVFEVLHAQLDSLTKLEVWYCTGIQVTAIISFSAQEQVDLLASLLAIVRRYGCAIYLTSTAYDPIRYVLCDLDGTLLRGELLAMLAASTPWAEIVEREIASAMAGRLDFRTSFLRRTAFFRGIEMQRLYAVLRNCPTAPELEELLAEWRSQGISYELATGNYDVFAQDIAARYGFSAYIASELAVCEGRLTGGIVGNVIDAAAKASFLVQRLEALGLPCSSALTIGDGANDLQMLSSSGHTLLYSALPEEGQALSLYGIYRKITAFLQTIQH